MEVGSMPAHCGTTTLSGVLRYDTVISFLQIVGGSVSSRPYIVILGSNGSKYLVVNLPTLTDEIENPVR
jgi:hypothetical protein